MQRMHARVRGGARNDILIAMATAIVLCIELFVIASGSGVVAKAYWRIVMFLIAFTCLGLSVTGAWCTVRAFIRMDSFAGLLLLPILLVHLFFFYYGVASFIEFVVPPPDTRPIRHSRGTSAS